MKRLIEKGLMFGGLVPVDTPALVARYNRALKKLTGHETALTDFYVDVSGFSPEVGQELGDPLYLNPNGVNRQFILLSTAQKSAPLLDAKFSFTRRYLQDFIAANEAELFALTTRDAVVGEIANGVFDMSDPNRLLDIRNVNLQADTTSAHVAEAGKLARKIERFKKEPDAWWDDVLIAEMIELAKITGDVTHNPISLTPLDRKAGNFHSSHFGGVFLFRDVEHPAAIAVDTGALSGMRMDFVIGKDQRNLVARFLELNNLVEPIVRSRVADAGRIIGEKMDFIVLAEASRRGMDVGASTPSQLRRLAYHLGPSLPPEFQGLAAIKRWTESGGQWPRISSEHPAYFYSFRAVQGPDRDLVNMLLAELTPLDFRQLYLCHKDLFYATYSGWQDAQKEAVSDYLMRYVTGAQGDPFDALFADNAPERENRDTMIHRVGPWGAVKRSKR